jgi:hypothetical protein
MDFFVPEINLFVSELLFYFRASQIRLVLNFNFEIILENSLSSVFRSGQQFYLSANPDPGNQRGSMRIWIRVQGAKSVRIRIRPCGYTDVLQFYIFEWR